MNSLLMELGFRVELDAVWLVNIIFLYDFPIGKRL